MKLLMTLGASSDFFAHSLSTPSTTRKFTCYRNHFIALVEKGGHLYEMDGRKDGPINHGATSAETFLQVRFKLHAASRLYVLKVEVTCSKWSKSGN